MKTIRFSLPVLLLFICGFAFAQTKTLDKTYKTNKDVVVKINTSHTNVVLDYWDRNEVKVEASFDDKDLSEEERKKLAEGWKPSIRASAENIEITSGAFVLNGPPVPPMAALAEMPEMLSPLMENIVGPILEGISQHPLPPQFSESMGSLEFDFEAYRKDGDEYIERFEKQVEENFGDDFDKEMEEWAAQFEKDSTHWKDFEMKMEVWGDDFGKDMEAWGEKFGKKMEAWGESFGKDMERWAEQFEAEMEAHEVDPRDPVAIKSTTKIVTLKNKEGGAKKTIKIQLPRNATLQIEARYGDVNLNGKSTNLKANLAHSKFSAETISGKQTNVKVAYTPVRVQNWDYGVLEARYVKDFNINKARSIKLNAKSSDVVLNEIAETGILSGSFGKLKIGQLQPDFKTLEVNLENSDMQLSLPNSAYIFSYNGNKSKIKTPSALNLKTSSSYDNESLNGYHKTRDTEARVHIKASYSDVLLN